MTTQPELTEFEKKLARSLRETPAEWTPACCTEETLWDFAEQGGKHPDALNLIRHISSCTYCTQGYFAMKEALQLRRQSASSEEQEKTPLPVEFAPAWPQLSALLKVPRIRFRLQLGGMALAGTAVMLFLMWPRSTKTLFASSVDSIRRLQRSLQQSEEASRHLQEELTRQDRQSRIEIQAAKTALAQEKEKEKKIRRLLASASVESKPAQGETLAMSGDLPTKILDTLKLSDRTLSAPGEETEEPIVLLRPNATLVGSLHPTLVWRCQKPIRGVKKYEITIVNTQKPQDLRLKSIDVNDAAGQVFSFRIPASSSLYPAATYRWSIRALDAGGNQLASSSPNKETRFRTLTASELVRLSVLTEAEQKLMRELKAHPADVDTRKMLMLFHTLTASQWVRLGVFDEAEQALAQRLKAHPADTDARKMLEKVRRKHAELKQ